MSDKGRKARNPDSRLRSIEIDIYDQRYTLLLTSTLTESEVRQLAAEVDLRMREISEKTQTADSLKAAILTALHLAEELRNLRRQVDRNEALLFNKSDEWTHALEQVLKK